MYELSEYERAYLECAIDAEGNISCTKAKDKRCLRGFYYKVWSGFSNTSPDFLMKLDDICDNEGNWSLVKSKRKNVNDTFHLYLGANTCRWVLPQLSLVIKEELRILALEALRLSKEHSRYETPHDELLEAIYQDMKRLNRKGKVMEKVDEYDEASSS